MDASHGYEANAAKYLQARSAVGTATVRTWANGLPRGGRVLDLGCGSGLPVTRVLTEAGLHVYALDASPTLVKAFRVNLPEVEVRCEDVLMSDCYGLKYDGIVAIGLVFLLDEGSQEQLLRKCALLLRPAAQLLFTAPREKVEWEDVLTGGRSRSLGEDRYRVLLEEAGLQLTGMTTDEGGNNYYCWRR